MTAVPVRLTAGATPELGAPSALLATNLATGTNVLGNAVARDGRFLLNATVGDAPTPPIVVVVGWQAGSPSNAMRSCGTMSFSSAQ